MNSLHIMGSTKTPSIEFLMNGELKLEGKSIPENCIEFYKPVIDWLTSIKTNPPEKINMSVKLEYINTSSSKTLLNIFRIIQEINESNKTPIEIKWYYDREDADLLEEGQNYQNITHLPLTFIPY
jgi:hypothetical protein